MTDIVYNKNGVPFDIDAIATDLNGKMDRDGVNAECPTLLSRTPNSQGGVVEIWSDGYCVQTGILNNVSSGTIVNLPQAMVDTNYKVFVSCNGLSAYTKTYYAMADTINTSSFRLTSNIDTNISRFVYKAEGYIR